MKISALLATLGISAAAGALLLLPVRGAAADTGQQVEAFAPPAGKAAIYIYRIKRKLGPRDCPVRIDGKHIGDITPGDYYRLELEPGEHEVWVGWTRGAGPHAKVTLIPISAQVGQSYFVRVEVDYSHNRFAAVSAETGKAELLDCCRLVAPQQPASAVF